MLWGGLGGPGAADPLPAGTERRGGRHGRDGEPAQEDGVQGEAAARPPRRAPSAAFRARAGVARPVQRACPADRPGADSGPRAPWRPGPRGPSRLVPVPDTGPGKWGAAAVNKGASWRPPAARPLLLGLSLEQSVGQNSFCFRFYKHKEKVV